MKPLWAALACAIPLAAQAPLTLADAVRIALDKHPAMEAAAAGTRAASARIRLARSTFLPKVSYQESFARSDNPVFVFSSLLTQHQFTEANFRIGPLNRPDFLNNFQSQAAVEQNVFDWGFTRANVRAAEVGRSAARETERRTSMDLVARTVRAYYGAVLAEASATAAREALKSAEADLSRAESVRQAGMSTDADVLSIRVHVASVQEQEIRRKYDAQVAIAALNETLGLPLGAPHSLTTPLNPPPAAQKDLAGLETAATENRPEVRQASLAVDAARQQIAAARTALLPQFGVRGAFEANRQEFIRKGGANWLVAASMRWNLFDGFASRAQVAQARGAEAGAQAQQRQAGAGVRLEVHRAWADARSAEERIALTEASVAHAEESLRITKNRYEAGLTTVTDLLRTEVALLDARTRRLAAIHDARVAAAQLELAAGTLTADSEVLK